MTTEIILAVISMAGLMVAFYWLLNEINRMNDKFEDLFDDMDIE